MPTSSYSSPEAGILVVDDDPDISQTLLDFLEHEGYHVETAALGMVALERCKQHQYAAVVLDLGLPDIDGLLVLQELHQHDPKLPVIILTAFSPSEKTPSAVRLGAFALLTKPYNREQLKATLQRAIGVKALATKVESIEQALAASERRFRSVVQSASDAVVLADAAGRVMFWNRAAERLFAYSEDEMLGRPLTMIMPDRFRDAHRAGVERLRAGGDSRIVGKTVELCGLRKDGTEVPIELSLGAWKVDSEAFYCGIIRDTTERKRAEQDQREHLRAARLTASVSTAVSQRLSLPAMLQSCVQGMVADLDAVFAGVWLIEESEHCLRLASSAGSASVPDGWVTIHIGQGTLGRIAASRRPELLDAVPSEFRGPGWLPSEHMVSFAAHPLVVDNRLIGVLAVGASHAWHEQILGAIRSATDTLALGIERKQTQASLERLTRRYESILNSAGEGIYGLDQDGRTTFVNEAAATMVGYAPDELLGRSMHDLLHHSKTDGTPYPVEACPIYASVRDGRSYAADEDAFWRKDGSCFPVEYVSTALIEDGRIVGAVVVFKDISERMRAQRAVRDSEERFQQVMAHLRDVVWMSDPEKNAMLYVSPGYEDIWGRSCESLYTSPRSWLDAVHPDDRERVYQAAIGQQVPGRYVEEYRIVRPDGSIRWIRDRAFPIRDASGVVYRIAGIAQDITEQRQGAHDSLLPS